MKLECRHCNASTSYMDAPPKFCSNCGQPFEPSTAPPSLDQTQAFTPESKLRPDELEESPPKEVAGYRMTREIGRGGMGIVYEAEELDTGRPVALKLLQQHSYSETAVARFIQEGRVAASLSHPKSTFVYSAGEDNEQFFISMELMSGGTLRDVVESSGALTLPRAVDYVLDIVDGLLAAHEAGIVHRDVKPSNCFLDENGGAKVGDYGLSKSLITDAALTQTGAFMGTPQFAAPEQIKGGTIDNRTDVYAVGALMYYLLAGEAPFQGDVARVIADIASEQPTPIEHHVPALPREVARLVRSMLSKEPRDRPQSLEEVRSILLPFATESASMADIGRRLAAYFVDVTVAVFVASLLIYAASAAATAIAFSVTSGAIGTDFMTVYQYSVVFVLCLYFAFTEWRFGCGVGKWMMRLRVVDAQGARPRLWMTLVRSLFIPGLMYAPSVVLSTFGIATNWPQSIGSQSPLLEMLMPQILQLASTSVTLLLFVTMRESAGYRGIHEWVSTTHVTRAASRSDWRLSQVPITVPVALSEEHDPHGSFTLSGVIGVHDSDSQQMFVAKDAQLDRASWVLMRPSDSPEFTASRKSVARSARLRWLGSSVDQEQRWDAFEAVQGAPLTTMIELEESWTWTSAKAALIELSEELQAALADDSLPATLDLSQIWIDRTGGVKLLDQPLNDISETQGDDVSRAALSDVERSVSFFKQVVLFVQQERQLPVVGLIFVDELLTKTSDEETLRWSVATLKSQPDQRAALTWDERLGVIAVSCGVESVVISTICFVVSCIVVYSTGLVHWGVNAGLCGVLVWVPAIIGYVLQGGFAFQISGVSVRHQNLEASRWRCAWRTLLAYWPSVIANTLGAIYASNVVLGLRDTSEITVELPIVGMAFMTVFFGAIVSIVLPRHGIQDLLSNTYLLPK